MTHPSHCVTVSLSPSFSHCTISCFPLKFKFFKTCISLSALTPNFITHCWIWLSPLHCNAADVAPLLVLTSENLRKNLAIILQCSRLKGERLNPLLCAHLCRNAALISTASLPMCLLSKAGPKQWVTTTSVSYRHIKAQLSTQFDLWNYLNLVKRKLSKHN